MLFISCFYASIFPRLVMKISEHKWHQVLYCLARIVAEHHRRKYGINNSSRSDNEYQDSGVLGADSEETTDDFNGEF